MISGPPPDPVPVPATVHRLAGVATIRPVWRNELGGVTFQLGAGSGRRFVKWQPPDVSVDLAAEAARLSWAGKFTPVPRVLELGADEQGNWLLTEGVPGETAVAERWLTEPRPAVVAIGEGLRAFHQALPVAECPFRWLPEDGQPAPGVESEQLVVCHGDACAPNTLVDPSGRWAGHVDLGALGVGDRWADLAIATWSTQWNYGPGWEHVLLAAYGVAPDPERTRLYRELWGSGPSGPPLRDHLR
jgi:kanamycin kinase